jgi:hypothetical protein
LYKIFLANKGNQCQAPSLKNHKFINTLKQHDTASKATFMQGFGLADRRDFNGLTEYLARLGLIETSSGGRRFVG